MRVVSCLLLLVALPLAGCLDPADPGPDPGSGPSHQDVLAHRLAEDTARLLCEPDYAQGGDSAVFKEIFHMETPDVSYGEIDVVDGMDLVLFARFNTGGFDILNVSDPYEPEAVASYPMDQPLALDVKASGDRKTVYVGTYNEIAVVDISDPYNPETTRIVPLPTPELDRLTQAHMLHVAQIDGEEWVFAAAPFFFGVLVFKATGEPGDRDLEFVTMFAPLVGLPLAAHDMMVYHDPVEERPILWVANGFGGFVAADVSDPSDPVVVSYSPEIDPYQGYTHTVSVTHYGDRRIMVSMAEIGAMALKVYDVTDMLTPVLLATWTIDTLPTSIQHNTQIMGDWLWMGHYNEGVILFDLKAQLENLTLPAYNLGLLSGVIDTIEPFAQYVPTMGTTWESVVVNGIHWTTSGGIYATLNGCFPAGDPEKRAYM